AEDGIRAFHVTGVQTCALPIFFDDLRQVLPGSVRVEMLHGRMPQPEKDAVMDRFRAGDADVLVSTTVIEVGVDVPNATVMVVEKIGRASCREGERGGESSAACE